MNRRSFFGRMLGAVAALVGVKAVEAKPKGLSWLDDLPGCQSFPFKRSRVPDDLYYNGVYLRHVQIKRDHISGRFLSVKGIAHRELVDRAALMRIHRTLFIRFQDNFHEMHEDVRPISAMVTAIADSRYCLVEAEFVLSEARV